MKEQIDRLNDVISHGLNFCESAMASKDFELYAIAVHRAWVAIKQRLGAIRLVTIPTSPSIIHVQVETSPGVFVTVIREVQDNHISHIVEPRGIQKAIEEAR
ncbi:MAG TPA: hypothetical protein VGM94_01230 [Galbitalea sp.]